MASLSIDRVTKTFGHQAVLKDVSLDVRDGEFLTLVGASGCGKSTVLRVIAGLEPQDSGSILIGGGSVDHLRPKQRNVAMVFQSYALYPHMTVADNIAMPLVMQRLRLAERLPLLGRLSPRRGRVMAGVRGEVEAVARQLQIDQLLARKPAQLSGGQRQRVALGRAMVRHPQMFLMDEPLSNLDAKLRVHMRAELTELHRRLGSTFIYVTHDQVEAMTMSDRVALMDEGRIVQLGTPNDLYHDPLDLRVARFIGSPGVNVLPGRVSASGAVEVSGVTLPVEIEAEEGTSVAVGLRPETLSLDAHAGHPRLAARLHSVENLGAEVFLRLILEAGPSEPVILRTALESYERSRHHGSLDGVIQVSLDARRATIFDAEGRRIARRPVEAAVVRLSVSAE
ncbi:glycerol-3-phosphate ABC transporter ATP-binding protein [Pleomorphomonas diazotrophica]|uniref:Glycerol-3-phosphate ABC transporter ATP-binding protein n=1 Tax=Pleomorphomonas diazotrophica TaxID=1166257 RepID=A0A1I4WBE9_9HYPH|nr:ABC transporter ATP-binding protein [Pleomorphomonas diazotrophica]PKR89036.1 glycerol-3-phosphate ABC transporter ATP-binding protein [Pleomorphomonas diazotrophica]SFN10767.1 carbohydrate ABC transporter ATP-binding protein, CUT1 family [Pleomorphomonas diazotrophica]